MYVTYDSVLFIGEERLPGLWADAFKELCKMRRLHMKDGSYHDTTSKEMARESTKFEFLAMDLSWLPADDAASTWRARRSKNGRAL